MVDNEIVNEIAKMNKESIYSLTVGRPISKEEVKNFIEDILNCCENDEYEWIIERLTVEH